MTKDHMQFDTVVRVMMRCLLRPRGAILVITRAAVAMGIVVSTGCSPADLVGGPANDQFVTEQSLRSPAGARSLYSGVRAKFQQLLNGQGIAGYGTFVAQTGLMTDEFQSTSGSTSDLHDGFTMFANNTPEDATVPYRGLQQLRGLATQAIGTFAKYAPGVPTALRAELFAMYGYAEVMLAELYCSGIPLSEVPFEADIRYRAGSTTEEVLLHSITMFDSAIAYGADSARVLNFARVGKGRALLALGEYAAAATAVQDVPTDYVYYAEYSGATQVTNNYLAYDAQSFPAVYVPDGEGRNGIPWLSTADPRVPTRATDFGIAVQAKYPTLGSPVPVASGIEARLIAAEAAVQVGNASWLTTLNTLRTTCTIASTCATPAPAGTGMVEGLPPLDDPGARDARIDRIFRERAFWLFATGHRQGDLRRLVREYDRDPTTVYPTGPYVSPFTDGTKVYGDAVSIPVPKDEMNKNPLYLGCADSNV